MLKAVVVKPLAHCKCRANFYSLITSLLYVTSPNGAVLKCICVEFKGLPNGVNFILIDHLIGELLSINKVSRKRLSQLLALIGCL